LSVDEPVARIMVENVFTVTGEAAVADAAALMANKRISCLPISMGQGAVGVVTEKDIIQKVVAEGRDPKKVRVKDIMSTPLILAPATISIKDAAEKMLSHEIRRLVITDDKGKLIGLATMTDIIRWIAQGQGNPNYILRYLSDEIG